MKGTIMSRMLMALGVVAALSLFPTEVTAVPFPVVPVSPVSSEIIVPGYQCIQEDYDTTNIDYANNSIINDGAAATVIICPLPRPIPSASTVTVTVSGSFTPASACAVVALNTVPNFTFITGSGPFSVPVSPDASLSLECGNFSPGDFIKSIRVKSP